MAADTYGIHCSMCRSPAMCVNVCMCMNKLKGRQTLEPNRRLSNFLERTAELVRLGVSFISSSCFVIAS